MSNQITVSHPLFVALPVRGGRVSEDMGRLEYLRLQQGHVYQQIIEKVLQMSQTDFEENGVEHQTLQEMGQVCGNRFLGGGRSRVRRLVPLLQHSHPHPHPHAHPLVTLIIATIAAPDFSFLSFIPYFFPPSLKESQYGWQAGRVVGCGERGWRKAGLCGAAGRFWGARSLGRSLRVSGAPQYLGDFL